MYLCTARLSNETATPMAFELQPRRVALCVYPACVLLFWGLYARVWPALTLRLFPSRRATIHRWSSLQHACFHANMNSLVHCVLVVLMLMCLMGSDDGLWRTRVHPYPTDLGHAAMAFSLVCV